MTTRRSQRQTPVTTRKEQILELLKEDPESFDDILIGESVRFSDAENLYSQVPTKGNKCKLAKVLKDYNAEITYITGLTDKADLALAREIIDDIYTDYEFQEHVEQDGGYSS